MPLRTFYTYFTGLAGLVALVIGLLTLAGWGVHFHKLLGDRLAGIVLVIFGITMLLAACFPFMAYYLTRREPEQMEYQPGPDTERESNS